MNSITDDEFNNLLDLCNLEVPSDEREYTIKDISSLLAWVETLNEVDTKNVLPLVHNFQDCTKLHDDIALPSLAHTEVLDNAPDKNLNYIVIPKVK